MIQSVKSVSYPVATLHCRSCVIQTRDTDLSTTTITMYTPQYGCIIGVYGLVYVLISVNILGYSSCSGGLPATYKLALIMETVGIILI